MRQLFLCIEKQRVTLKRKYPQVCHIHQSFLPGTIFKTWVQAGSRVFLLRESRDYTFKAIEEVGIYGVEYQRAKSCTERRL